MHTAFVRLAVFALFVPLSGFAEAGGQDRDSIRPYYEYMVSLDKDTRAVVGPVQTRRVLKVRLERAEGPQGAIPFRNETATVCIFELFCERTSLVSNDDRSSAGPEIDFGSSLSKYFEEVRRPDLEGGLVTATLKIYRDKPATDETLSMTVKVETDLTAELPAFSMAPDVNETRGAEPSRNSEHDGMDAKVVDLPDAAPERASDARKATTAPSSDANSAR